MDQLEMLQIKAMATSAEDQHQANLLVTCRRNAGNIIFRDAIIKALLIAINVADEAPKKDGYLAVIHDAASLGLLSSLRQVIEVFEEHDAIERKPNQ